MLPVSVIGELRKGKDWRGLVQKFPRAQTEHFADAGRSRNRADYWAVLLHGTFVLRVDADGSCVCRASLPKSVGADWSSRSDMSRDFWASV